MSESLEMHELPTGYVSNTQIEMLRTCPQRYYYRYILGIKTPPPFAIVRGTAGHSALNTYFKIKMTQGIPMLQDEFIDCFTTELDTAIHTAKENYGDIDTTVTEKKVKVKKDLKVMTGECVDAVVPSLKTYHQLELPTLNPVECEQMHEIKLSTGLVIVAKQDYKDNDKIVDFKFSSRQPSIARPTNQLILYSILDRKLSVRLDTIISGGKYACTPFQAPSQGSVDELLKEYNDISKIIRTGIVYRNPGFNDMNCSICGYKQRCRGVI